MEEIQDVLFGAGWVRVVEEAFFDGFHSHLRVDVCVEVFHIHCEEEDVGWDRFLVNFLKEIRCILDLAGLFGGEWCQVVFHELCCSIGFSAAVQDDGSSRWN